LAKGAGKAGLTVLAGEGKKMGRMGPMGQMGEGRLRIFFFKLFVDRMMDDFMGSIWMQVFDGHTYKRNMLFKGRYLRNHASAGTRISHFAPSCR
jgi:hypothetical protein